MCAGFFCKIAFHNFKENYYFRIIARQLLLHTLAKASGLFLILCFPWIDKYWFAYVDSN
jgi:hypothetical protein